MDDDLREQIKRRRTRLTVPKKKLMEVDRQRQEMIRFGADSVRGAAEHSVHRQTVGQTNVMAKLIHVRSGLEIAGRH